jgi:hypothetical protein
MLPPPAKGRRYGKEWRIGQSGLLTALRNEPEGAIDKIAPAENNSIGV